MRKIFYAFELYRVFRKSVLGLDDESDIIARNHFRERLVGDQVQLYKKWCDEIVDVKIPCIEQTVFTNRGSNPPHNPIPDRLRRISSPTSVISEPVNEEERDRIADKAIRDQDLEIQSFENIWIERSSGFTQAGQPDNGQAINTSRAETSRYRRRNMAKEAANSFGDYPTSAHCLRSQTRRFQHS